ncbi:MAG: outer membrane beta-barrel protein [Gemmatimonadaceae bacterium]
MNYSSIQRRAAAILTLVTVLFAVDADGQAWNYPSFQPPVHVAREYNFAIASGGDAGATFVGQWREGFRSNTHLGFEAGVSDGGDGDSRILLGAGFATTVFGSQPNLPLDIHLTAGAYPSFGGGTTLVRVPVGLTLGKRLALQNFAMTPYAHPRLSLDFCSGDFCFDDDNLDFSINFDLGADIEINPQLGFRVSILLAGGDSFDDNAFGVSLAWRPLGVSR